MKVGLEKLESHEGVAVKALLDSGQCHDLAKRLSQYLYSFFFFFSFLLDYY